MSKHSVSKDMLCKIFCLRFLMLRLRNMDCSSGSISSKLSSMFEIIFKFSSPYSSSSDCLRL